ncbi:MAG: hypothetical protein JXD21_06335 [Candidatus Omnitrophica bacterium]|nr:hypothetical protein [Candidatus Omnitrophota bacterium]
MKAFLRIWQEADIKDIEQHLMVVGELSAECYHCHAIGLDLNLDACPQCRAFFKYVGFRRKVDANVLIRFCQKHPRCSFIDFEDFKKALSKDGARKLLDM